MTNENKAEYYQGTPTESNFESLTVSDQVVIFNKLLGNQVASIDFVGWAIKQIEFNRINQWGQSKLILQI